MKFIQQLGLLFRVHHWIKNGSIFLPIFFAGALTHIFDNSQFLFDLVKLFFAFSFASSFIYVINDSIDVEKDRKHPEKCKRPIASGYFSVTQAIGIGIGALVLFGVLFFMMNDCRYYVLSYMILNILYSFYLKNISIVDVSCISLGFVLRVLAGGAAVGVAVSYWMIIIMFLVSISIAFAKRRDDLVLQQSSGETFRKSQKGYTIAFIDVAKSISFSITLISYIMYSISDDVIKRIGSDKLYITSLFVFLGIMRYLQISIVEENSGSPIKILQRDKFLQVVLVCWIITFGFIIYGKSI